MDWQQPAALIVVGTTLVLLVRRVITRGRHGLQHSCAGCRYHRPGESPQDTGTPP